MRNADDLLTPAEAGRLFDPPLAPQSVKYHDPHLQPERTPSGRRLYRRSVVLAFIAERQRARTTASAEAQAIA